MLGCQMMDQPGSPQAAVLAKLTLERLHDLLVEAALVLDVRGLVGADGGAGVAGVVLQVGQLVGEVLPGGGVVLLTVLQHHCLVTVGECAGPTLITDLVPLTRFSDNRPTAGTGTRRRR